MSLQVQDAPKKKLPQRFARQEPLHTLLERLRLITGIDLTWQDAKQRVASGSVMAPAHVAGQHAGTLSAPSGALSGEMLNALAQLASQCLEHEREISELADELLRSYEQERLTQRIAHALSGIRDDRGLCEVVLQEAAMLLGASTASVSMRSAADSQGKSWNVCMARRPRGKHAVEDCLEDCLEVPIRALRDGAEAEDIGTLRLQGRRQRGDFTPEDRKLARALASQIGIFLRVAQVIEQARCGGRTSREREMTREAHASLLPREEPRLAGVEVAGACLPAELVGGDHYGYVDTEPGILTTMIAEVSNSGMRAAMAMAGVRSLLHAEASRCDSPATVLRSTNHALARDLQPSGLFATAFLARYDTRERRLRYAGAGHPMALVWRAAQGRFERLERGGLALGIFEDVVYEQGECDLLPGDLLVMFTDGLTETRNAAGEFYSTERLCREVMVHRHERPRTLMYRLLEGVEAFRGSQVQRDDLTLLVLRATKEKP